ncbi:MAG: hypothetical protein R2712_10855 [Vicinamibacterales bacterium]
MPHGRGRRRQREQQPRDERHLRGREAEQFDVQRQDGTEAAIDELQAQDDDEHHHEAGRAQQFAQHRSHRARGRARLPAPRLDVQRGDEDHGGEIERRGRDEGHAQAHQRRQHAADHGAHRRPEALRNLDGADGLGMRSRGTDSAAIDTVSEPYPAKSPSSARSANSCHGAVTKAIAPW